VSGVQKSVKRCFHCNNILKSPNIQEDAVDSDSIKIPTIAKWEPINPSLQIGLMRPFYEELSKTDPQLLEVIKKLYFRMMIKTRQKRRNRC
jgi:hypothetical protein